MVSAERLNWVQRQPSVSAELSRPSTRLASLPPVSMMLTRPRAPSHDSHLSVVGSPPWKPRRPPKRTGRAPGGDQDACARAGPRSGRRCLRRPAASSQTSSDCSSQPKVESALRRDRPQLDQTCVLLQRGKDCKTNSRLTKKKHSISFLNGNTTSAPLSPGRRRLPSEHPGKAEFYGLPFRKTFPWVPVLHSSRKVYELPELFLQFATILMFNYSPVLQCFPTAI